MDDRKKTKKVEKSKVSEKLHVEIASGNWKRLDDHMKSYNDSPYRITPRIKPADVINDALAEFLNVTKDEKSRG